MRTAADLDVGGRRVLVRSDLNVPVKDGRVGDDGRIRASVPLLRDLLDRGASPIVVAHLGRPKGEPDPASSLAPVGEGAALVGVLARLARCPADVLQEHDPVGLGRPDRLGGRLPHHVLSHAHRRAEQLLQSLRDGREARRRVGLALRPAEVRHDDGHRLPVEQVAQQRHAGTDATVVADGPVLDRHVEVAADQDPLAADVEVLGQPHRGQRLLPTSVIRSARRFE